MISTLEDHDIMIDLQSLSYKVSSYGIIKVSRIVYGFEIMLKQEGSFAALTILSYSLSTIQP